jgi:putative nucleotidyltransferase with HDIG domain
MNAMKKERPAMKRFAIALLIVLAAVGVQAATLDELVAQAKTKYPQGNEREALDLLGIASQSAPSTAAGKKAIADAYTSIGVREYDRRNFKNAYECFRSAVKIAPTNQVASEYFWRMKSEMNVDSLANEADAAEKAAAEAAATAAAASTAGTSAPAPGQAALAIAGAQAALATGSTGGATAQPPDLSVYTKALEKVASAEQELETLKRTTLQGRDENAALKAELERQKKEAEQELAAIRRTAQEASLAVRDQNQTLKSELDQQKALLDSLRGRIASTDQSSTQGTKALTEVLDLYRQSIEKQGEASQEGALSIAGQLAEQRELLQLQYQTLSSRNMLIIAGLGLLGLLALLLVLLVVRAQIRRRRAVQAREPIAGYSAIPPGAEAIPQGQARLPRSESLLLEFYPESGEQPGGEPAAGDSGMYRDLLRAERIRRMHDQMKQGTLKWETVREYIGELEKDLRVEILKVVEAKILEGDGVDPRAILPVLFAFLTEHDEYLREKAESLARSALSTGVRAGQALLPVLAEAGAKEDDESPLGFRKLLEIPEALKKLLKERERSVDTAKVARGMARYLGFSTADTELLYKASLAHDAGYLMLDRDKLKRILGKTSLTEDDYRFIRSHARKGLEHFKGVQVPQAIRDAILSHHERNDGSGYPRGLTAPKIPLFAKIIGVAETFVALTSTRPYRGKLSGEAALAVVRDGIGRSFDREHVDALTEMVRHSGESL